MLKGAQETPSAVDATNGMTISLDGQGTAGLVVVVKNNGAEFKCARILMTASHLGAGANLAANVQAGAACMIADINGQWYAASGRIDIDFDPGFMGEISAFRLS